MNRSKICDVCNVHKHYCLCGKPKQAQTTITTPRRRCRAITRRPEPIQTNFKLPKGIMRKQCLNNAIGNTNFCARHKNKN